MIARIVSSWPRSSMLMLLVFGAGCGAPIAANHIDPADGNPAILWTLHSAEYRATCSGIFGAAAAALPDLLADSSFTAALEQGPATARDKPPAVIVDVDETMLNNSQFQWELEESGQPFDAESWDTWVQRADAPAVPGAVAYARRALALNATIFYVSNRACRSRGGDDPCPQATDTLENLVVAGFPEPQPGRLLLRGMRADWSNDKSSRRSYVSANYRIVQLLGDDLGDFVGAAREASEEQRNQLIAEHRSRWGTSWFLFPNPMYGSWQHARAAAGNTTP